LQILFSGVNVDLLLENAEKKQGEKEMSEIRKSLSPEELREVLREASDIKENRGETYLDAANLACAELSIDAEWADFVHWLIYFVEEPWKVGRQTNEDQIN
jgi:hypothetical protein